MYMVMFGGRHPFLSGRGALDEKTMLTGALDFRKAGTGFLGGFGYGPEHGSAAARQVCQLMATVDPLQRPSVHSLLGMPWFRMAQTALAQGAQMGQRASLGPGAWSADMIPQGSQPYDQLPPAAAAEGPCGDPAAAAAYARSSTSPELDRTRFLDAPRDAPQAGYPAQATPAELVGLGLRGIVGQMQGKLHALPGRLEDMAQQAQHQMQGMQRGRTQPELGRGGSRWEFEGGGGFKPFQADAIAALEEQYQRFRAGVGPAQARVMSKGNEVIVDFQHMVQYVKGSTGRQRQVKRLSAACAG